MCGYYTINCELAAKLINNPIRANLSTCASITITNSKGYLSAEKISGIGSKQSIYKFILKIPLLHSYDEYKCDFISVALSMVNPSILFSRVTSGKFLNQSVVRTEKNSLNITNEKQVVINYSVATNITYNARLILQPTKIREDRFLKILDALFKFNRDRRSKKTLFYENIADGIENYIRAAKENDVYIFLYIALEKVVNAEQERTGEKFDAHASCLTGLPQKVIKEFRLYNNRLKHPKKRKSYESKINILQLKEAVDNAIKSRLGVVLE